ncbi:MAG TPA: hypothetical protein PJ997_02740 [Candidatus Paceibacterota bacterium]|nr:hypothetical protein [Candidatus Paceibacterota bacterium]HMP19229.1 hypothetical protein [Candidatus Paceibacterota bacterium]HMP85511.1 hypothetical protein [Candidatus Paceibacterota bacterium]
MLDSFGKKIRADHLVVEEEISSGKRREYVSFYIRAQWINPTDKKVYIFYSDYLDYNPKDLLPKDVEVNIIPDNPNIYRMDLSWLPQIADKRLF